MLCKESQSPKATDSMSLFKQWQGENKGDQISDFI